MFAKRLEKSLTSANTEEPLLADIHNNIETADSIHNAAAASKRVDLDKQGTRLWNLSSKLKNTVKDGELLCLGKNSLLRRFYSCLPSQFASSLFFFSTALNDASKVPLQVLLQ